MTFSDKQSRALRLLLVVLLFGSTFYSLNVSLHWLLVFSLSSLISVAVLKRANPILYWPIGLLVLITALYVGYVAQWLGNSVGVDDDNASRLFLIIAVAFAVLAGLRAIRTADVITTPSLTRIITIGFMAALPVVLLVLVTQRWVDEPVRLISGHLAGGDHGAHNEIVHKLLRASGDVVFASPFQMYTYPQSLHFFIANLTALTGPDSTLPLLAHEYAMGAWVEWLQFAAYCQLAVVVFMKGAHGTGIRRVMFLPPLVFAFSAMDNFVVHLLWSGFTTSLGMTWVLLAFLAVADRLVNSESWRQLVTTFAVLLFFALSAWNIYQPYAVIFLGVAAFTLLRFINERSAHRTKVTSVLSTALRPSIQFVLTALGLILALIVILGSESPAVRSLLLDGSTYKPYLYTVLLWGVFAVILCFAVNDSWLSQLTSGKSFLLSHLGFVAGMVVTVSVAGGFSVFEQPYYIQKMFWILLFISVPVVLSLVALTFERFQATRPTSTQIALSLSVVIALLLTPMIQGRLPVNATKKHNVDWFANAIVKDFEDQTNKKVAFSWVDKLGSHLSNLALRATSDLVMPVETGISGNAFLACTFMNENNATLAYTTPNGRAEMVASGCDPSITYVENGELQTNPSLDYFTLDARRTEQIAEGKAGFRFLLRGFLPPERWGTWAGGYRSAIGFDVSAKVSTPTLVLSLRRHPQTPATRELIIAANGTIVSKAQFGVSREKDIKVALPLSTVGRPVELTLTCTRAENEIVKDDPVDGPEPCIGVKSMVLRNG